MIRLAESVADNTLKRICNATTEAGTMKPLSRLSIPSWNPAVPFRFVSIIAFCCLLLDATPQAISNDKLSTEDLAFFETNIRPVLAERCYSCHSSDADELGGKLKLDSLDGIRQGGQSGPLFDDDHSPSSLLLKAIRYEDLQMPPDKPLSETIVKDFTDWVQRGAPYPGNDNPKPTTVTKPTPQSNHWAFRSPQRPGSPNLHASPWPSGNIDGFVLAQLQKRGRSPSPIADPRSLIRRLSIDLIGLPPNYRDVLRFEQQHKQNPDHAMEQLVDRLLASPYFGQRWGRHWLDVARYAESNGNDGLGRNSTFPHAWRYRDYVIDAFNRDLPYDEFLIEQIAGDLLPAESDADRDRKLVATGFLALTAKPANAMNKNFAMDIVADQIDVVTRGVMGLSVACARCHDHKFDPISIDEYYALAGIFTSTQTMWGTGAHEKLTAPPTDLHVLKAAAKVPPPEGFAETVLVRESNTGKPKPVPKSKWPVGTPLAMGVRDKAATADCKIHVKGDVGKLGAVVPRGFPAVLQFATSSDVPIDEKQSGRLQLAHWLTRRDHPLTSRVMANRVWHHLFGQGLVETNDEFGQTGQTPTHPALLDYLAARFVERGWSIKQLVREIVLSRTYQQSCQTSMTEPDPSLLSFHRRRRLDAESLRDAMLTASGDLDLSQADGSIIRHRDILMNLAGNLHQPSHHRSVFLCYLRQSPPPELSAFNLPDFSTSVAKRETQTLPDQALYLYNNPFVIQQSQSFAKSVLSQTTDSTARIKLIWQRSYQRNPTSDELAGAQSFLQASQSELETSELVWQSLCQAVLISNEFRYID